MRHRVYGKKLGRNKNERTRLFKSLVQQLFLYGTINTSESKAKSIKGLVDKIINSAKSKNSKQLLQSFLISEALQDRLIKDIIPKLGSRFSGYTSLTKIGTRAGDQTMVVKMSLIGAEQLKPLEKVTSDKKQVISKKLEEKTIKQTISEKKGRTGQSTRKTRSTRKAISRLSKTK